MNQMRFSYPSSISQIVSLNDSFAQALLRVCYPGLNRNKTIISRSSIERAIPTMAYCPVVANYNLEDNTIGGHDVEIVKRDDGSIYMVNATDAIGVVPDSPEYFWETVTEEDGVEHEYLCTPVLLWKRAAAYAKIKEDGIENQSMEITVNAGHKTDDGYQIDDFTFTAFCILGEDITPCFESASVELYSVGNFHARYNEMLEDFKREFSAAAPVAANENLLKGGDGELNMDELMLQYGLVAEDIDFDMSELTGEEIEQRFVQIRDQKAGSEQEEPDEGAPEQSAEEQHSEEQPEENFDLHNEEFSLTAQQFMTAMYEALRDETYEDPYWGTCCRYCYCDHDMEPALVYVYDVQDDWKLYGITYSMSGDHVVVDFGSKKRMKVAYVELEEGEANFSYRAAYDQINSVHSARLDAANEQIRELNEFRHNAIETQRKNDIEAVFARFTALEGDEAFVELTENYGEMTPEEVEDKCYSLLGRKSASANFSLNPQSGTTRLPIEDSNANDVNEPYGGAFRKYGIGQHK